MKYQGQMAQSKHGEQFMKEAQALQTTEAFKKLVTYVQSMEGKEPTAQIKAF